MLKLGDTVCTYSVYTAFNKFPRTFAWSLVWIDRRGTKYSERGNQPQIRGESILMQAGGIRVRWSTVDRDLPDVAISAPSCKN